MLFSLSISATDAENAAAELTSKTCTVQKDKECSSLSSSAGPSAPGESDPDLLRLERLAGARPSMADCLCYSFCYVGLFTGPFFKYRTWLDWTESGEATRRLSTAPFLLRCLAPIPLLAAAHFATKRVFPLDFVDSPDFADQRLFTALEIC